MYRYTSKKKNNHKTICLLNNIIVITMISIILFDIKHYTLTSLHYISL